MADVFGTSVLGIQFISTFQETDTTIDFWIQNGNNNRLLRLGTFLLVRDAGFTRFPVHYVTKLYGSGLTIKPLIARPPGGVVLQIQVVWRFAGIPWFCSNRP